MIFLNDPFQLVYQAFNELYPDKQAKIYWQDTDNYNAYGVTFFGKEEIPVIFIDPDYSIRKATETLIHELAHVVAGYQASHSKEWEEAEEKIKNRYLELIKDYL